MAKKLHRTSLGRLAEASTQKQEATYQKTVLPNGIRVVSEQIPHVRSVSVGIWINTGSRDESREENGISHFIEHMVFKGTAKRSMRDIAQSIESVGGYLNAFTSKEHTCFYARVLDEHTELALDVISDIVLNPTFPGKELEKEKGVVIEELRNSEDDPDDIIHDYFEKAVYGEHPLGFPVIGAEQNLRSFTRSDLSAHRLQHYVGPRIVVAGAGNLKHQQLVDLVGKYFRNQRANRGNVRREKPSAQKAMHQEFIRPIQQAHVCLGTTTFGAKDKRRYPLMVLNTLLGDGMSSRLFQNIREKYGFAYSVYSFANLLSDTGTAGAYIGTDPDHVPACVDLIWKELDKLRTKPVGAAELKRTKDQLKGSMMLSLESISNRMIRLGSSELYFGELPSLDAILHQINGVESDDILSIARELFQEARFATVTFKPDGSQRREIAGLANAALVQK